MERHKKLGGCEACNSFGAHKKGKMHEHDEFQGGLGLIYDKNDEIAAIWGKKESILSRNLLFITAKRGFL